MPTSAKSQRIVFDLIPSAEGWMIAGALEGLNPVAATLRSAMDRIRQVAGGSEVPCQIRIHSQDGSVETELDGIPARAS
jgi:hypothetical protein